jgi:hypothetical protein
MYESLRPSVEPVLEKISTATQTGPLRCKPLIAAWYPHGCQSGTLADCYRHIKEHGDRKNGQVSAEMGYAEIERALATKAQKSIS